MLRPERISIVAPDQVNARPAIASGRVSSVAFIGSLTTLGVELPDATALKIKTTSLPSQRRPKVGDAIDLRWEPDDFVVLGSSLRPPIKSKA